MRQRCRNPRHPNYLDYGGRGIEIDPSWEIYRDFLADMGKPLPRMTLERRDNEKGYSKENCYWATMKEQNENKRVQGVRNDNLTGRKGVGYRPGEKKYLARGDQKSGTPLLYYGPSLEDAIAARVKWEEGQPQ